MDRRIRLGLGTLLAAATLAVSVAAAAQQVNVYSARHYDSDNELFDRFTEQTGISVRVLQGDSDQLIERIRREGAASPADVLITVDAGRLWRAEESGVLQSVESDVLDERIPAYLRHPEGLWFGLSQRMRVIFYNKEAFDPSLISTYEDLADPQFEGQICIRSSTNVYNQSLLASMIDAHGVDGTTDWARGLVSNLARQPQGGDTDQIRGVAAGECEISVANHYYYVRLAVSDDPADREVADRVGIIFPNQDDRGIHVNVGGAGVVAGAPNRDNAIRLLEYLASDEAQELFAKGNHEYPVVDGVPLDEVVAGWGEIRFDELNVGTLGRNNPDAVRIADRVGWR
ncbi:iron(III) transport system substrate-binding protein [Natronocella acetinitrilica]|uniref:Iron(III) transport system substrate-binding protein n=1 Tax=Natronocella acetinitrilica TaxID=414046 RepID=A0AAE3KAI7_9GAMM|nr:Fe(3+) ABC transporter substrate-binding protein [Natronocella acetinitrilica]MCP1673461.1 iron(III) transport system substrate-binding protein [Natronocella acetinitrilica]